ncbi:TRAP transporter large permease [Mailhella sp.]|uniref:TRAP transporter large permease n=1 Tax=Mailhella sp. TaxID=1981029 RepID=UPI00406470B0
MSFTTLGIVASVMLLVLLFCGVHMGVDFFLVGFIGLTIIINFDAACSLLGETLYNAVATPSFCVLPLFMLMGAFASRGGFAKLAYESAHTMLARIPGSLAIATTFGCAVFGSICGSTIATATIFGRLAFPEMERFGYKKTFALGSIGCSGSFACMIPPSGMFILFAIFTDQSVGKLFLSGILPGILTASVYAICMLLMAKYGNNVAPIHPDEYKVTVSDRVRASFKIWPIMLLATLVMGGIYTGIFTSNEAAAVGAAGTLCFGLINGELRKKGEINSSLRETARSSAMLFIIIIASMYFSRFLAVTRIPTDLANFLVTWEVPPYVVLMSVIIVWFILGMLIAQAAVFAMTLPVIFPVLVELGYDPIWICVIAMKLNEIAGVTPPVGINSFALAGVTNSKVEDVFAGTWPFIICDLIVITILCIFPSICTILPYSMIE